MRTSVKIIGITLLGLLLFIGAIFTVIAIGYSPNDYKEELSAAVRQQTGYNLSINGDITLSFFPWLGVAIKEAQIAPPSPVSNEKFITIANAGIHVRLLPLLRGKIHVSAITIEDLTINLHRDASGQTNWTGSTTSTEKKRFPVAPPLQNRMHEQKKEEKRLKKPNFFIHSIAINNVTVTYTDTISRTKYAIENLSLSSSAITPGTPATVLLSGIFSSLSPHVTGTIDANFSIQTNPQLTLFSLSSNSITLKTHPNSPLPTSLSVTSSLSADLDTKQKRLTVHKLSIAGCESLLHAKGEWAYTHGRYKGNATLTSPLRRALASVDIQLPQIHPTALQNMDIAMSIRGIGQQLSISNIRGKLDNTTVTGEIHIADFARPDIRYTLDIDTIDLNSYFPPTKKTKDHSTPGPAPQKTSTSLTKARHIPLQIQKLLRNLQLDGKLRIAKLQAHDLTLHTLFAQTNAQKGIFSLSPLRVQLAKGTCSAHLKADLRKGTVRSQLSLAAEKIALAPLLTAVTGKKYASGTVTLKTQLSAIGDTWTSICNTLSGNGAVTLHDGYIYGFSILPNSVQKELQKSAHKDITTVIKRHFVNHASASYSLRNGKLYNNDLIITSPAITTRGAGYVNFADNTIDYTATLDSPGLPSIPFYISGTLTTPHYGFDAGTFLQDTVTNIFDLFIPQKEKSAPNKNRSTPITPLHKLSRELQKLF